MFQDILKALRELPAKAIVECSTLFKDWDVAAPMPWKPCLDPKAGDHAFLPLSFPESLKLGHFAKGVPVMAGFTSEEGLILASQFYRSSRRWRMLFNNWDVWAPLLFFNRETDLVTLDDIEKVAKVREKFFPHTVTNGLNDHGSDQDGGLAKVVLSNPATKNSVPKLQESSLKTIEQIFSTSIFHAPMAKDMQLLMEQNIPVYAYEFGYRGSMTLNEVFRLSPVKLVVNFFGRHVGTKLYQKDLGVCHGDDMFYLFPFSVTGFPKPLRSGADKATSKRLLAFISK